MLFIKATVIGLNFFVKENDINVVTVNTERYIKIINNLFVLELQLKSMPI